MASNPIRSFLNSSRTTEKTRVFSKFPAGIIALSLAFGVLSTPAFALGKKKVTDFSGKIIFSGDVPLNQVKDIQDDLKRLHDLTPGPDAPAMSAWMQELLGIKKGDGPELELWLRDRVRYILGEDFNADHSVFVAREKHEYLNPFLMPVVEEAPLGMTPLQTESDGRHAARLLTESLSPLPKIFNGSGFSDSGAVTVMSNFGSALYFTGKINGLLVGIKIPGAGEARVVSPRAGIIKIGAGLFKALVDAKDSTGVGDSMSRLSTFFHEARHSDGNGASLSFLHAVCPKGHDLEHINACDRNLNGPYTVGGVIGRHLTELCEKCSVAEKEALRLSYLDSFGRVIRVTAADAQPRHSLIYYNACLKFLSEPEPAPKYCSVLSKLEPAPVDFDVDSRPWDDSPEGSR